MTLAEIIESLKELESAQPQFSQSDVDAKVAEVQAASQAEIDGLKQEVLALPDKVHAAVLAEDADLASKLKPILDALLSAQPQP